MSVTGGIYPALLTPFKQNGEINEKALQKLVKMNIDKGVDGFYVCGSSAEAFLLSLEERKYVLEIVAQEAAGKCSIISHIGSISTDHAIELAKHAKKLGADAISSVPPFYYKFSFAEIKEYYFDIVTSVDMPMIIYNVPAFSGVTLTGENIREFFCDDRFIGIKHTSNDFYSLERMKQNNPNVLVYNGYDEMFLAGLAMGADGGIGCTYNIMAEKFLKIMKLFREQKPEEAQQVQTEANDIIAVLLKVGVLSGAKELLTLMGLDFGECRRPFKKICYDDRKLLREISVKLQYI